jgi:hypothetical protein
MKPKVAHEYLCMGKTTFNSEVRPYLDYIIFGRGIWFSRVAIDNWVANNVSCCERPDQSPKGDMKWVKRNECQDSINVTGTGTSTKSSGANAFEEAAAQKTIERQKPT